MLLLCSSGLTSPALLDFVKPYLSGCRHAALVVTADNIYKEENYHSARCKRVLEAFGLTVDLFDLDHQAAGDLLGYDAVEFIGGNPFYLLNSIRKSQAAQVLHVLARERVLIGWSAAVFVFGPSLELVNRYSPEMNTVALTDLQGIGLTDIPILPHYSRFLQKIPRFEEICAAYEQEKKAAVIRLNDGDGLCIQSDNSKIIRA